MMPTLVNVHTVRVFVSIFDFVLPCLVRIAIIVRVRRMDRNFLFGVWAVATATVHPKFVFQLFAGPSHSGRVLQVVFACIGFREVGRTRICTFATKTVDTQSNLQLRARDTGSLDVEVASVDLLENPRTQSRA